MHRDDPDLYLHLIAFIAHQYYRLQDNLIDVLLASLRSFQNGAIREHGERRCAQSVRRVAVSTSSATFVDAGRKIALLRNP